MGSSGTDEASGLASPAAREHGHEHAGTDVPHQVHRVKPRRRVRGPIERVRGDGQRAVGRHVDGGREVGRPERLPDPGEAVHHGVRQDDREVVEDESMPQDGHVDERRRRGDEQIQTPCAHGRTA